MDYAFVSVVVGIVKPTFETIWHFLFVNSEAMILSSDVAALGINHDCWLVLGAVAEFQLVCVAASGKCQELIA